jgi:hypothetical protein
MTPLYAEVCLRNKILADVIESIIGVFWFAAGEAGGVAAMKALGLISSSDDTRARAKAQAETVLSTFHNIVITCNGDNDSSTTRCDGPLHVPFFGTDNSQTSPDIGCNSEAETFVSALAQSESIDADANAQVYETNAIFSTIPSEYDDSNVAMIRTFNAEVNTSTINNSSSSSSSLPTSKSILSTSSSSVPSPSTNTNPFPSSTPSPPNAELEGIEETAKGTTSAFPPGYPEFLQRLVLQNSPLFDFPDTVDADYMGNNSKVVSHSSLTASQLANSIPSSSLSIPSKSLSSLGLSTLTLSHGDFNMWTGGTFGRHSLYTWAPDRYPSWFGLSRADIIRIKFGYTFQNQGKARAGQPLPAHTLFFPFHQA